MVTLTSSCSTEPPNVLSLHGGSCDPWEETLKVLWAQSVSAVSRVPDNREDQVKHQQSAGDIKSLIVIGKILRDYSTVWEGMENSLSNTLPQITTLHADVSNSLSVYATNLVKCVYAAVLEIPTNIRERGGGGGSYCPDTCRSWVTWLYLVSTEQSHDDWAKVQQT